MNPGKDFTKWYIEYNIPKKPNLNAFAALPLQFQLGVFLQYFYDKGYIIIVSNLGYKIRKKEDEPPNYIASYLDTFGIDDPLMTFYKDAITNCFELINNPF